MIEGCSFCEKRKDDVVVLIAAQRAMICEQCVALCVRIIAERARDIAKVIDMAPETKGATA